VQRPLAILVYLAAAGVYAQSPTANQTPNDAAVTSKNVIDHLNQTITWYRRIAEVDQSSTAPENLLLQNNVHATAKQVLKLAFDYARAEANLLSKTGAAGPVTPAQTFQQATVNAQARADRIQSQLDDLDNQIAHAKDRDRPVLAAKRRAMAANLALAKDAQTALRNMVSFANAPQGPNGSRSLLDQINNLESLNSAVDAPDDNSKTSSKTADETAAQVFHPENAGIITLISKATTLANDRSELDALRKETDGLLAEIGELRAPLRTALRNAMSQSDALANAADASTPDDWNERRKQIDALGARFKQLSSVLTPLSQQSIVLRPERAGLEEWRNALDRQYHYTLRFLFIRLGSLLAAILFLLLASALWQRAIFRYVHDPRRRRQFMVVKRIVVGLAMALILALGFLSSLSSVVTLLGFITAGLALALQNVILSIVAYFFLVGRYGVRAGDRVTVSGVTGQVIEVGLVRLFLMELTGIGADLHPTGRVASFANSIIFQPSALMKQAPGMDYVWHSASAIVADPADHGKIRERLAGAVERVYSEYRPAIERQHATFERSTNMQTGIPRPVTRANFTDSGLEILIRYPVDAEHALSIDDRVVASLWEEAGKEPKMQFAAGGAPKSGPA
jgi:small-conductance mechanosensitive channel